MRYQSKRTRRQFLAGVSCSKCQSIDSIVQVQVFEPKVDEYIECTECGYQERRPTADSLRAQNSVSVNGASARIHAPATPQTTNAGITIVSITE